MDEYTASYYYISGHTQKRFAGSSRIWYERLKIITLPRNLVSRLELFEETGVVFGEKTEV